jgi:hypothetical protein
MTKMARVSIAFLLVLVLALLNACENQPPVQPAAVGNVQSNVDSLSNRDLLQRKGPWPAIPDSKESLASDLLAKNYYIVQDGSGSMGEVECSGNESKSVVSKKALAEFAKSVPAEANLGLLAFDSRGVTERLPLGKNNRTQFINAVNAVKADSGTPLDEAIMGGLRALEKQAQKQLGYGEYHLVIITDGYANWGHDPTKEVEWIVNNTSIVIHTIGFCVDKKHSLNMPGKTFYVTAQNPKELFSGLKAVLAESEKFDITTFQK